MNVNDVAGQWQKIKGSVKEYLAELTDNDILEIEAQNDLLIGKIQQRYHISEKEAEFMIDNMEMTESGKINNSTKQSEKDIKTTRRLNAEKNKID